MEKQMIKLLLGMLLLGTYSCNEKPNTFVGEIIAINYNNKVGRIDLHSIMDSTYSIIPLETSADFIIGKVDKLDIKDNKIFILDNLSKSIFIFDLNGKFLYKINELGHGPGEYINLTDMTITDSTIVVVDHYSLKQIEYSYTGEFKNENRIFEKLWCNNIFYFNNNLYYINDGSDTPEGKYLLFSMTSSNKMNSYFPFSEEPISLGIKGPTYSITNKNASIIYSGNDIIYSISKSGEVEPKYLVKYNQDKAIYKNNEIESVLETNAGNNVLGINAIYETNDNIFLNISLINSNNDYNVLFDKKAHEIKVYNTAINSYFNDEDVTPDYLIDNKIIIIWDASMLKMKNEMNPKKNIKNQKFEEVVNQVIDRVDESDNPVLFLFKLKD